MVNFSFPAGLPYKAAVLAALVISGLLLAFHGVLEGAVQQGESRRRADAVQAEASLHCRSLRGALDSSRCLLGLGGAGGGEPMLARNFATGGPVD